MSRTNCLSRRTFLRAGALGMGGLSLADLLAIRAHATAPAAAAKSVIMIYLVGGQATVKQGELDLAQGDSLLIEPGESAQNVVLTGGGDVILAKLGPVS